MRFLLPGSCASSSLHSKYTIHVVVLGVLLVGLLPLYYAKTMPDHFGFSHDDSLYVTGAKALATGKGYRIISLPGAPAQTKYPPLYSFLLSLIWRVYPEFPDNILFMMVLSSLVTVCFLAVAWFYLVHRQYASLWQALVVIVLVGLNWRTMMVATGIYSEMTFASLSVVALMLADRQKEETSWASNLLLGLILGLAVLTRSAGVALIIAVGIFSFMKGQRRRALAVSVGAATLMAWMTWCYFNRTGIELVNSHYYTNYLGHLLEVMRDLQSVEGAALPSVFLQIALRNAMMLVFVSIPVVVLGVTYDWIIYAGFAFVFVAVGFVRELQQGTRLLHLYVGSYLFVHVFWLPFVSYDRFLLPLLPFLTLFLVKELTGVVIRLRDSMQGSRMWTSRLAAALMGTAVVTLMGIATYGYAQNGYYQARDVTWRKSDRPAEEDGQAMKWIVDHTGEADVVACYRDPTYFLYTGRTATRYFAMKAGVTWERHQDEVFSILAQNEVDYLVWTRSDFGSEFQPSLQNQSFRTLMEQHSDVFVPVFRATDGDSTVYRIEAQR